MVGEGRYDLRRSLRVQAAGRLGEARSIVAGVAQLAAHLSCKQVVRGSSPLASSAGVSGGRTQRARVELDSLPRRRLACSAETRVDLRGRCYSCVRVEVVQSAFGMRVPAEVSAERRSLAPQEPPIGQAIRGRPRREPTRVSGSVRRRGPTAPRWPGPALARAAAAGLGRRPPERSGPGAGARGHPLSRRHPGSLAAQEGVGAVVGDTYDSLCADPSAAGVSRRGG